MSSNQERVDHEWNHLLCLFNISRFSSAECSEVTQKESGEERVTAKSRPMMNLTARMPSVVSSSTSSSPGKTWYGYQDPGKSVVVDDRSGQPDRLSPAGSSKSDYDRSWSSQEWKSEVTAHDRSGKPDKTSWRMVRQVRPDHEEILFDGTAQGHLEQRKGSISAIIYCVRKPSENQTRKSKSSECAS